MITFLCEIVMSKATVMYFSGDVELVYIHSIPVKNFIAIGGKLNKHNYENKLHRYVGHPKNAPDAIMPLTRKIFYKKNPSLHKCDARCQNATGHVCECSCGGKFHGINA